MSATISVEDSQAFSDETNSQRIESIFNEVKNRLMQKQHRPDSTYRIQFNREFTFKQACEQIPYLKQLGISDLYASPYFRARAESMHGYDIAAHNELNPSIGTEEDYNSMVEHLHRHGMAQILDTVPNHMGIGETSNAWWMDVLENGPSSLYAPFFDIDWHPLKDELTNKVLLPVLGEMYGRVLENKELQLKFTPENGTFQLYYYDHCFPVNPRSYQYILEYRHDELLETLGAESDAALEYESILTALRNLPRRDETERERMVERAREKEIIKRRIAALCQQEPRFQQFIEQNIETFNGVKGEPRSFDRLAELLENQSYRLSYWRVAAEEINYRRFFDVNELAAIRVDQPEVFEESHRLIFRLLREGKINGVRTDHIDGLRNPRAYLQNLQRAYFLEFCRVRLDELQVEGEPRKDLEVALLQRYEDEVNANPDSTLARSLYVVVEKILGRGESLPTNWPTYGTTGYEFTNLVNALFVDGANEKSFDQIYSGFLGEKIKFADLAYQKKKQIMWVSLASEINVLTNQLNRISESDRFYRDLTLNSLRNGIREVIACFPVYRTYITRRHETPDKADQQHIETAVSRAKKRNPTLDPTVFDFIRDVLLLKYPEYLSEEEITARYNFVMKFQQTTSPIMAKGLEDTAFYIYNRLISLNEVGGEPDQFGITLANFHRQQAERQNRWPYSLLTTSTHDTKRSEDVRARINVLSEWPKEWKAALTRWSRFNRKKKITLEGSPAPGPNEEYFLYQTLLGVWPFNHDPQNREAHEELVERVKQYMCKAMKEAKVATSWVNPNQPYEEAVLNFVTAILDPNDPKNKFLPDFVSFQKKVAHYGAFNALSQTLLKLTSPGVPDIYQGNETWDFSLVDPDNRRPVDYALRQRMLSEMEQIRDAAGAASLVENKEDGRIKLYITSKALKYRQEHRSLFETGTYTPLEVQGSRQDNVCAFARNYQDQALVVVAPRLLTRLAAKAGEIGQVTGNVWADSSLVLPVALGGIKRFRNIFTGEVLEAVTQDGKNILPLDQIFTSFPVAMLEKIEE
jgi:(1->4)-alpha-D-glucan 1-alpha-D-glucosylmutase